MRSVKNVELKRLMECFNGIRNGGGGSSLGHLSFLSEVASSKQVVWTQYTVTQLLSDLGCVWAKVCCLSSLSEIESVILANKLFWLNK